MTDEGNAHISLASFRAEDDLCPFSPRESAALASQEYRQRTAQSAMEAKGRRYARRQICPCLYTTRRPAVYFPGDEKSWLNAGGMKRRVMSMDSGRDWSAKVFGAGDAAVRFRLLLFWWFAISCHLDRCRFTSHQKTHDRDCKCAYGCTHMIPSVF
jgi:hypothetical protein